MARRLAIALGMFVVLTFSGCGGSGSGIFKSTVASPTITSIAVSCNPSSIQTGQTSQCSATVLGTGGFSASVTWTATNGTITPAGMFTPSGSGTATITATSTQDTSKFSTASVAVNATSTISSVGVTCNPASILPSQTTACTATVSGTGNFNNAVTWTATNGTITTGGVFTPAGSGNATITATSVQDTTKSGTAAISVGTTASTISAVAVTCTPSSILTTQTSACSANVTGTGAFSSAVSWSVSPSTAGKVSSAGVFTPSGPGTAMITATSTQDPTKFGTATVAVNASSTITGVTVNCTPGAILTTQTSACVATVTGSGPYSSAVTWSATGGTITAGGVFAPSGAGSATITATSAQDATKFGSTTVVVTSSPTIVSVGVSCTSSAILTTQTSTCSATVVGTGSYSSAVTWSATGGTITSGGVFTPSGAGTAMITATSTQDTTKFGSTAVTVTTSSAIVSVSVSCAPSTILTTQTSACTATVTGTGSYSSAVTWSVSPSTLGSVSSSGVFTPNGSGTVTITATSTQDTTKFGTATVTVNAASTITAVSVVCSPSSILTTQTSTCVATVSGTGSYSTAVSWSATGGTITAGGVFTPSGAGAATIKATSVQDATKFGTTTVTVTSPSSTITSVAVSCAPTSIQLTQTSTCTGTVSGAGSYSSAVTWTATDGTITSAGVFTPSGAGTATITATSVQDTTKSGSATVTIASPIQTVFMILMENQNWNTSVPGNFTSSNAPYIINTIMTSGATANNYGMANSGPSEPNYLWLEAGYNPDPNSVSDADPSPSNSTSITQHLVTYLNNAGISWKAYVENIDGLECPLVSNSNSLSSATTIGGGSANYYAKHNPFAFFDDLTNNLSSTSATCISHVRPYSELASDLSKGTVARYNFIVPNGTDDMHDSDITTGDTWLSQNVPAILGSSAYQNNGALFVMWDESQDDSGTLPFFVLSPFVKRAGYVNSIKYNHNSTLWTLQEIFGVGPCLEGACGATDLSDLFQAGVL